MLSKIQYTNHNFLHRLILQKHEISSENPRSFVSKNMTHLILFVLKAIY